MKPIGLIFLFALFFVETAFAVQSIRQPFSVLTLTDGRVLKNAKLISFNSNSVFVRSEDGVEQIPYKLFPTELQPQLKKVRAELSAEASSPRESVSSAPAAHERPGASSSAAPFSYRPLSINAGSFVEAICCYDQFREVAGGEAWARVLKWDSHGVAFTIFEMRGQLWAWSSKFGFQPLGLDAQSKDDIKRVSDAVWAKDPPAEPPTPAHYWYEPQPQQPEANLPTPQYDNINGDIRDASIAGARLGAHRPVNLVQFSLPDGQISACIVFIFDGQFFIYAPKVGTGHYAGAGPRSLLNIPQLRYELNELLPGASSLKTLNYGQGADTSGAGQN